MRPHQKEGVTFLYEAVLGMKPDFDGRGAILADEMFDLISFFFHVH